MVSIVFSLFNQNDVICMVFFLGCRLCIVNSSASAHQTIKDRYTHIYPVIHGMDIDFFDISLGKGAWFMERNNPLRKKNDPSLWDYSDISCNYSTHCSEVLRHWILHQCIYPVSPVLNPNTGGIKPGLLIMLSGAQLVGLRDCCWTLIG